jgi:hypothetical protein
LCASETSHEIIDFITDNLAAEKTHFWRRELAGPSLTLLGNIPCDVLAKSSPDRLRRWLFRPAVEDFAQRDVFVVLTGNGFMQGMMLQRAVGEVSGAHVPG